MCPKRGSGELEQFLIVHQLSYVGLKLAKPRCRLFNVSQINFFPFSEATHITAKCQEWKDIIGWFDRRIEGGKRARGQFLFRKADKIQSPLYWWPPLFSQTIEICGWCQGDSFQIELPLKWDYTQIAFSCNSFGHDMVFGHDSKENFTTNGSNVFPGLILKWQVCEYSIQPNLPWIEWYLVWTSKCCEYCEVAWIEWYLGWTSA